MDDSKQIKRKSRSVPELSKRLFIAAELPDALLDILDQSRRLLKRQSIRAALTKRENLHCTLKFIGEVEPQDYDRLIADFDKLKERPWGKFTAGLTRYGYFRTRDGLTVWGGLKVSSAWFDLVDELEKNLAIIVKDSARQKWLPHVTLARRVQLSRPLDELTGDWPYAPEPLTIGKIALYLSEFTADGMRYTPLATLPV